MHEYIVVTVPEDLLPQIVGEILVYAVDPNFVEVVHGENGREIHAHPDVANAWYTARQQLLEKKTEAKEEAAAVPQTPTKPATPAKKTTSA